MTRQPIDELAIRDKAYELWERRGRPHGSNQRDWYEAERLLTEHRLKQEVEGSDAIAERVMVAIRYGLQQLIGPVTSAQAEQRALTRAVRYGLRELEERCDGPRAVEVIVTRALQHGLDDRPERPSRQQTEDAITRTRVRYGLRELHES